jgi:tetratricopeptide (TPR) repeat protein
MQRTEDTAPGRRWQLRVLAALAALTLPGFVLTASVTRAYHGRVEMLASDSVVRADDLAKRGRWAGAIDGYRAAIALGHESPSLWLHLAQALARAGRTDEARSYLLSLHDATPGDALVNLELARLAASANDTDTAVHYYHDAIDGAWTETPQRHRRETRLELAAYLARRREFARSQAELLPLTSELPTEASTRARIAQLLAETGSPAKAFDMFRAALTLESTNGAALAGAGHAAFELSNYRTARQYLSKAAAVDPGDGAVRARLTLVDAIIDLDPFTRGLSAAQRAARVSQALDLAITQAIACPPTVEPDQPSPSPSGSVPPTRTNPRPPASAPDVAALRTAQRQWRLRRAHTPDDLDATMGLVFDVEDRASEICGALQGRDLALRLIGRERRASER